MTDWERFAQFEYVRMASEEDEEDGGLDVEFLDDEGPAQVRTNSNEAPF